MAVLLAPWLAHAQAPTPADGGAAAAGSAPASTEEGWTTTESAPDAVPPPAPKLPDSGLSLAVRLALGVPVGTSAGSSPQSSEVALGLPIGIDVGYRFLRHLYVGAYGSWAFDVVPNSCPNTCYDARFGVEAEVHGRYRRSDPWFGAGAGYEILHGGGGGTTITYRGWELVNFQAGVSFRSEEQVFRAGPFLGLALGEYDHVHETNGATGASARPVVSLHGWVMLGARGEFDL